MAMYNQLSKHYGAIDAAITISDISAIVQTGGV